MFFVTHCADAAKPVGAAGPADAEEDGYEPPSQDPLDGRGAPTALWPAPTVNGLPELSAGVFELVIFNPLPMIGEPD